MASLFLVFANFEEVFLNITSCIFGLSIRHNILIFQEKKLFLYQDFSVHFCNNIHIMASNNFTTYFPSSSSQRRVRVARWKIGGSPLF